MSLFNPRFTLLPPPWEESVFARGFRAKGHCAMQYSKWETIANRHGERARTAIMPHAPSGLCLRLLAILIPLGLSACADTLTSQETTSSATLQRQYDKTLTKSEQKAVISDLQSATDKKQGAKSGN
jgi:hypothetical protein